MMAPQCPWAGGICKITPTSLSSRWALPGHKHGLIKMKLQYMLIPYFSNPTPPTPNPCMCTPTSAHPVKYYNLSQSKRYKSALRNCKNSTKHSQASLYLVRRLWFSIAGVSRAHSPPLSHSLSACGTPASVVAMPPAQPQRPVSLLSPRGFLIESDPIMRQQLAINVINYSSTLVTSECDADVECVYGAFSVLPGLSQSWWGKGKGSRLKKKERKTERKIY